MRFRSQLGLLRRQLLSSMYSRRLQLGNRGPIVSFTFDDFPRSAVTVGGSILRSFGARGTYYAAMGLMNTSNELGDQFSGDDLEALLEDGHELASHTFAHVSCRAVSKATFVEEAEKGRRAISEVTGNNAPGNFAFPFGDITLDAKRILGTEMASCRTIWSGLNGPEVDMTLLRANSLYGDIDNAETVQKLILENQRQEGWLIFYSHDVQRAPSRFGCTPSLLESALCFASRQGARILTVAEVVAELTGCTREDQVA